MIELTESGPLTLARSHDVPAFGDQLFSAGAATLHAALVEFPSGGAGSFTHTESDITYIERGDVWLTMDGFAGWVHGGSLLVLPAGVRRLIAVTQTRGISIGLGSDGLAGRHAVQPTIVPLGRRGRREWLDRAMLLVERPATDRSELLRSLGTALSDCVEMRERTRHALLAELLRFIEGGAIGGAGSLRDLGDRFGYAPNHLNEIVRRHTGRSIRQWEIGFRLEAARRLLKLPPLSVGAVAAKIGLDAPYFARSFRKRFEMSPSVWRNAVLGGTNLTRLIDEVNAGGVVSISAG